MPFAEKCFQIGHQVIGHQVIGHQVIGHQVIGQRPGSHSLFTWKQESSYDPHLVTPIDMRGIGR